MSLISGSRCKDTDDYDHFAYLLEVDSEENQHIIYIVK